MSQPITFQTYDSQIEAMEVGKLLQDNGIEVQVEKPALLLDNSILGVQNNPFLLKIAPEDFSRAKEILMEHTTVDLDDVDSNYTLLHLSNKELTEIVAKPDEWGVYNYKLALLLLEKRGLTIPENQIERLKEEHRSDLAAQRSLSAWAIISGYFLTILGFISIIGIVAPLIGMATMQARKTLPDGKQMFIYDNKSRKHGWNMFLLGVAAVIFNVILTFYSDYSLYQSGFPFLYLW